MLNLLTALIRSTIRIIKLTIIMIAAIMLFFSGLSILSEVSSDLDSTLPKRYRDYTLPLKTPRGERFCSSVSMQYRGTPLTVTNNHCCDAAKGMPIEEGHVIVGNYIEKILHQSNMADICVLTSHIKDSPIRLADKELQMFDKILVMGYPRGDFLVPRYGMVILLGEEVCINYGEFPYEELRCVESNFTSATSYGGNSGSPIFNEQGELVNLLYAGPVALHTYSITVPLVFLQAAILEAYLNSND